MSSVIGRIMDALRPGRTSEAEPIPDLLTGDVDQQLCEEPVEDAAGMLHMGMCTLPPGHAGEHSGPELPHAPNSHRNGQS